MKIEVISNEKNTLEFYLEGERHTLPNLLKEKLNQDAAVEFCAYRLEHPLDKKSRFIIKTTSKAPKKVLDDALKGIQEDLDAFKKAFDKASK
ncbi:MAG: DNA-directed RNA polymerase subunit L [archaeon]